MLKTYTAPEFHSVYALHRNDPLYKAFEPALKSLGKIPHRGFAV